MSEQKKTSHFSLIWGFLSGCKRYFAISMIFSFAAALFNFLIPQVVRFTVDSIIGSEPANLPWVLSSLYNQVGGREALRNNLLLCSLFVLLFSVLEGLSTYIRRVNTTKGAEKFVRKIHNTLYGHIQRLPYLWHVQHQTGDIIQRCTSDVELVRTFVSNQVLEVFRLVFLIVSALIIMFNMYWKLALVAVCFLPITLIYSGFFFSKISKRFKLADEAEGSLSACVQENLTGVRVVRAFGRERYEIEKFDEKNHLFADRWVSLSYLMGTYWGVGDFFTGLQTLTILTLGTIAAVSGELTLGTFLAFLSYNGSLVWPIRSLGRMLSEMSKANVSIERIAYILNAQEEKDDDGRQTPPMNRDIVVQNLSYRFENTQEVLKNLSFTIPAGSTFAILGGTGSGKSTLMHLLNRLYDLPADAQGSITIGGVPIQEIRRDWVRKNIGMVLQEPFLFSRTIRENIQVFRPEASLDEVRRAAQIACIDDAIVEFTNGYDTIVGERGVTLSGGQKQRVAIARMLMQNAPIMVFDDSLSAVDSETDSSIRKALHENLGGSTVILISHRITTLMQADTIMVLENGEIAEMGTHEQLIANNGVYKQIYDIQMSSDDRFLAEDTAGNEPVPAKEGY